MSLVTRPDAEVFDAVTGWSLEAAFLHNELSLEEKRGWEKQLAYERFWREMGAACLGRGPQTDAVTPIRDCLKL